MARVLEEHSIATVTLNMFHEVADYIKPPRTIQTNFVFGSPFGSPHNKDLQLKVIKECLLALENLDTPGSLTSLPYSWK